MSNFAQNLSDMNVFNKGIAQTIKIYPLKKTSDFVVILHHQASNTSISLNGYFVGSTCYFYLDSTSAQSLKIGNYDLSVYDDKKQNMYYCNNFAVCRNAGLTFQSNS